MEKCKKSTLFQPKPGFYLSTCFRVLLPVSMVGLTFSYFGLGLIFLSKGGIFGFCLGFIRLMSILVVCWTTNKGWNIPGFPLPNASLNCWINMCVKFKLQFQTESDLWSNEIVVLEQTTPSTIDALWSCSTGQDTYTDATGPKFLKQTASYGSIEAASTMHSRHI